MARRGRRKGRHGRKHGGYHSRWSLWEGIEADVPPKPRAPRKKKEPPMSIEDAAKKPARKFRMIPK